MMIKNIFTIRTYNNILEFFDKFANIVYTIFQVIFSTIGVGLIFALTLFVEIPRARLGIEIFDSDPLHSLLSAILLVLSLIVTEVVIERKKNEAGYNEQKKPFSVLGVIIAFVYFFIGPVLDLLQKEKKAVHPAAQYIFLSNLIKFGIITISFIGVMRPEIISISTEHPNISWVETIIYLLNSDILIFSSLLTSAIFTVILVLLSSGLSKFITHQAILNLNATKDTVLALDRKEKEIYLLDFINKNTYLNNKLRDIKNTFTSKDKVMLLGGKRISFEDHEYDLEVSNDRKNFISHLQEKGVA